jgi:ketosteroid isomerase-like protein
MVSAQTSKDTSTVKKQIMLLNQQMEGAFNNNDMTKVAAYYADEGEIVYDNYTVRGRTNLDKYWMDLKDKSRGWKLSVVEIGGQGEFVYQLGKSDLKYISQGKETTSITNFVLLWRKQSDGSYKIFRDYLTKTKFEKNEPGNK